MFTFCSIGKLTSISTLISFSEKESGSWYLLFWITPFVHDYETVHIKPIVLLNPDLILFFFYVLLLDDSKCLLYWPTKFHIP